MLNKEDAKKCFYFAQNIVLQNNQHERIEEPNEIRIFRTFLGKIGELYIHKQHHYIKNGTLDNFTYSHDMFDIYEGTKNVDITDFYYKNKTVDIKTIWANNHKNIIIPIDQKIKDYYIGVKIITKQQWNSDDFNYKYTNIQTIKENITKVYNKGISNLEIIGFVDNSIVLSSPIKNFGASAYFVNLNHLNNDKEHINNIISNITLKPTSNLLKNN